MVVAMKEGVEEVVMHLPEIQDFVPEKLPSIILKDDTVDALLPLSFFGAKGTKYLNDANKGKKLAFRLAGSTTDKAEVGTLRRIENGGGCLRAIMTNPLEEQTYSLPFEGYDFLFLE